MKTTRSLIAIWAWPILVALIFVITYFGADIIEKGVTLNELTPWGKYLGIGDILWGIILWAIWILLIKPIIDFYMLMKGTNTFKSRVKAVIQDSKRYPVKSPQRQIGYDLETYYSTGKVSKQQELLEQYEAMSSLPAEAQKIVDSYSNRAALAVLISRSPALDGLILLGVQVRMIAQLAKLYGYTPSPIFIMLCSVWVFVSSTLQAIFGDDIADAGADLIMDMGIGVLGDAAATFVARFSRYGTEWVLAQVNVRVTAAIFIRALKRTGKGMSVKEIMKLRKGALLEVEKTAPQAIIGLFSKTSKQVEVNNAEESVLAQD